MSNKRNSEYIGERNRELWQAIVKAMNSLPYGSRISEIYEVAVNTPCSRLWITPESACKVISLLFRHKRNICELSQSKADMMRYIIQRLPKGSKMPSLQMVEAIVYSPAPRFFIQPNSAMTIINNLRKRWRKR